MDRYSLLFSLIILFSPVILANESDLEELDRALERREEYQHNKEHKIDNLKKELAYDINRRRRLEIYNLLYDEYITLNFDSCIVYIDKAEKLAAGSKDYDMTARLKTHRAYALAVSGHFSQAAGIIDSIDSSRLTDSIKREYFKASSWIYGVWAEYSQDKEYAPVYTEKRIAFLDSMIAHPHDIRTHYYNLGEKSLYNRDFSKARDYYHMALDSLTRDARLYPPAAYALAQCYYGLGDHNNYRKWLIYAAISDQILSLKENLALQDIAFDIKNEDLFRANRYLHYALEDALHFNNRLRILQIGKKTPDIVTTYQDNITVQNKSLRILLTGFIVAAMCLIAMILIVIRQRRKLQTHNKLLSDFNTQLNHLNTQLYETNRSREQYVNLFMDLCVAYIDKFNRFQLSVTSKVKARQFEDLLRLTKDNARPSEAEIREMFFNFDTAFLRLYPDFISEFNSLLQPDKQIIPKDKELLNTDLRIFALIRIGVTDSIKIATLMFYSPQTIFNHRTQVRNRAINRARFEKDLMNICVSNPE